MSRKPYGRGARRDLLCELRDALERPVVAVCAGTRGYNVANLDRHAARVFVEMLRRNVDGSEVALLLYGEGGYPEFADEVIRVLRERRLDTLAVVPHRVSGVFTSVALACDRMLLHEYGSLGPYDQPLQGRHLAELDATIMEAWRELPKKARDLGARSFEIARDRHLGGLHGRLLDRAFDEDAGELRERVRRELGARRLGEQLSLGASELGSLGLNASAAGEHSSLLWELFETYEELFELKDRQEPLFMESDVANEVEFEPARGVVGAVIEGPEHQLLYELDTGRPDPDTGMLDGEWLWSSLEGAS